MRWPAQIKDLLRFHCASWRCGAGAAPHGLPPQTPAAASGMHRCSGWLQCVRRDELDSRAAPPHTLAAHILSGRRSILQTYIASILLLHKVHYRLQEIPSLWALSLVSWEKQIGDVSSKIAGVQVSFAAKLKEINRVLQNRVDKSEMMRLLSNLSARVG